VTEVISGTNCSNPPQTTYTYNALNQCVATSAYSEFLFDPQGRKVSEWDSVDKWEVTGWNYWGAARLSFYFDGTTRFEHQDWLGTERARTSTSGAVTESFGSLPFGDGFTYNAPEGDWDYYHFAGYDQDRGPQRQVFVAGVEDNSSNEHAQFREYSNMAGRWFSPDPYQGSYDPTNPPARLSAIPFLLRYGGYTRKIKRRCRMG